MNSLSISRREFLRQSNTVAVATGLAAYSNSTALSANEKIQIGVIGCGERGRNALINELIRFGDEQNATITAVCDVWQQNREKAAQMVKDAFGKAPKQYEDYREVIKNESIDAVVIATPEHQHATMLKQAAEAGKDAYCEKPLAMNLDELKEAVDAVKKHNRVVQVGTQLRSYPSFTGCRKVVQDGQLGKIVKVTQVRNSYEPYWFRYKRPIEKSDTNWNLFLFNKESRPFDADRHTVWYGYMDYSMGPIATMMCHYIDLVHYITGAKFPSSAVAMGGSYYWKNDDRTQLDSVHALLDYPEGFMVSYSSCYGNGARNHTTFQGSKGIIDATDWRKPIMSGDGSEHEDRIQEEQQVPDVMRPHHMEDWLQCLRTRKQPNADIDAGCQHAVAAILAYEAMMRNHRMGFDAENFRMFELEA